MAPRRRFGLAFALGALGALSACAGNAAPGTLQPADDGIYDFTANTGERSPLRGRLTILAGAMALEPEMGICRVDAAYPSMERTRYICDNASDVERLAFLVDHRRPLSRSSWTGQVKQRRTRTVCIQYSTQGGRQVCVRSQTETYEALVPVSGPLTFRLRT